VGKQHLVVNRAGRPRRETLNGREHLVVPMTMIVPGILNGSRGALYYSLQEISRNVSDWNGVPILLGHPQGSGRNPKIINRYGIGTVFNSRIAMGRLKAEAWLDIAKLQQLSPGTISIIERGDGLEISTGFNSGFDSTPGVHNGLPYHASVVGIRPDHLAVFTNGDIGACSIKDGCGVNNRRFKRMVNNSDGVWRTIRGSRVLIEGGKITKGPKALKGKSEADLKKSTSKKPTTKKSASKKPKGLTKRQESEIAPREESEELSYSDNELEGMYEDEQRQIKELDALDSYKGWSDAKKIAGGIEGHAYVIDGTMKGLKEGKDLEQAFFDAAEDENYYGDNPAVRKERERVADRLNKKYGFSIDPHWEPGKKKPTKNSKGVVSMNVTDYNRSKVTKSLVTNCGCNKEELDALNDETLDLVNHAYTQGKTSGGPEEDDDDIVENEMGPEDEEEEEEEEGTEEPERIGKKSVVNRRPKSKTLSVEEFLVNNKDFPDELKDYLRGQNNRMQEEKQEIVCNISKTQRLTLTEKQLLAIPMEDTMIGNRLMLGLRSISELCVPQETKLRVANFRGQAVTSVRNSKHKPTALGLPHMEIGNLKQSS